MSGVGFDYRKSDQPQEGSRFYLFEVPCRSCITPLVPILLKARSVDGCIRFHRAQFLDVLVDHLPQGVAHFGKRLVSYRTAHDAWTETELLFADGSVATCDVLIGCDGIKSVVRKQMLEDHVREGGGDPCLLDHIEPVWSGSIAYRGLIPVSQMVREDGVEHRTIQSPMMVSSDML